MYRSHALLLSALLWLAGNLGQATVARAEVSQQELAALQGRVVGLERLDGLWVLAKILRVDADEVVVELEDGTLGSIRLDVLARVHTSIPAPPEPPEARPRTGPAALAHSAAPLQLRVDKPFKYAPNHETRVEWVGARGYLGALETRSGNRDLELVGGAEVTLFALHWKYFYWEAVRLGGNKPLGFVHGTTIGVPIHLDRRERHELRIGAHLTFMDFLWPGLSGAQLYYQYRPSKRFGLQLGIMQHSSPLGFSITFGLSM